MGNAGAVDPCTVSWDGGAGTNVWGTAANWSGDTLPGSGDKACIFTGTGVVHSSGTDTVGGLESDKPLDVSGGTLTVGSTFDSFFGAALTVSGGTANFNGDLSITTVNLAGGTLGGANQVSVTDFNWSGGSTQTGTGVTRIPAGGTLDITDSSTETLTGGRDLNVLGAATWVTGNLVVGSTGTKLNLTGGTLEVQEDQDLVSGGGLPELNNLGTITKTAGTANETILGIPTDNDGTIRSESGKLLLSSGVVSGQEHSGAFVSQGASTTVELSAGTTETAAASSFTGSGTTRLSGGTLNHDGTTTVATLALAGGTSNLNGPATPGTVNLTSGTLGGTGQVSATDFNWSGGSTQTGTGETLVAVGATLDITDSNTETLSGGRDLTVNGAATWVTGNLLVGPTGTELNLGGTGTLEIQGDQDLVSNGGTPELNNLGTITKTVGTTGEATLGIPTDNDGTMRSESGKLALSGGVISGQEHSGAFVAQGASTTVEFSNGTTETAAASSFTGTGTGSFAGGTHDLDGTYTLPTTRVTGGTANFDGATTTMTSLLAVSGGTANVNQAVSPATVNLTGGTLGGTGQVSAADFNWSGGGIQTGTGETLVAVGATLDITDSNTETLSGGRDLTVNGAATWVGGNLTASVGTKFNLGATGTLEIQGDQDLVNFGGTPELNNLGTITKTAGTSGAATIGIPTDNDGTMRSESGNLALSSGVVSGQEHAGAFVAQGASTTLELSGGTTETAAASSFTGSGTTMLIGGTLNHDGTTTVATLAIAGAIANLNASATPGTVNLTSGTLGGTGQVAATDFNWSGGTPQTGTGETLIASGATLDITDGSTEALNGGRELTINGAATWVTGNLTMAGAGTNLNLGATGTLEIQGDQDVADFGSAGGITNLGTIRKSGGTAEETVIGVPTDNDGTLDVDTGVMRLASFASTSYSTATKTLLKGTYLVNGILKFPNADITTNSATVVLDGSAAQVQETFGLNGLRNLATNAATGSLTIKNGKDLTTPGALSNAGIVAIGQNSDLVSTGNYTQSAGTTSLDHSSATLTATGGAVQVNGGVLQGVGTVGPSLVNAAEVRPGTSPGLLNVAGNYTQQAGGILRVDVGGLVAGTDFDKLNATGAVALAGTLAIDTTSGYTPANLDTYRIVEGSSRSGTFATVNGQGLGNGRFYLVNYNPDDVTLEVRPEPTAEIDDVAVTEGNAPNTIQATFTISLDAAPVEETTVDYATADDTATQPADYTQASGTAVFAAGDDEETVSVTVKGDDLDEPDERLLVNLTDPVNATVADPQGQGTITDDDPTPTLSIDDVTVTEGDSGQVAANFQVALSAASGRQVTVNYASANDTATQPGDYAQASGQLTFAPGVTTQPVTVQVAGDTIDEGVSERFLVDLTSPVNATIGDGQGEGTITDDDLPPAVSISNPTVTEGHSPGTVQASFAVTLDRASSGEVQVDFATADDTATQPADYTQATGTAIFPAGDQSEQVSVTVNGDAIDELDESFFVDLSSAVNATITDNQGVATIADDDAQPGISIDDVTVMEGASGQTAAIFNVTMDRQSSRQVTVNFATANDTATQPGDYTQTNGVVTFAPLDTAEQVTVQVQGDAVDELDERYLVNLTGAVNAATVDAQGQGMITDDDGPPPVTTPPSSPPASVGAAGQAVVPTKPCKKKKGKKTATSAKGCKKKKKR